MIDYIQKFRLEGKTAFVVGGLGLIGREISTAITLAGANMLILDIDHANGEVFVNELSGARREVSYRIFDCSDMEKLESRFSGFQDEFGIPDVFINCSYPRTDD